MRKASCWGLRKRIVLFGHLNPAGAKEAGRLKALRYAAARELDRSAPTIDRSPK